MRRRQYPQSHRVGRLQRQRFAQVSLGSLGVIAAALQCGQRTQRPDMIWIHLHPVQLIRLQRSTLGHLITSVKAAYCGYQRHDPKQESLALTCSALA